MAKQTTKPESNGPEQGFTRLLKTDAEGGYMDYPTKDVKKLLDLEKALGVSNYVLPDNINGEAGPGQDNGAVE